MTRSALTALLVAVVSGGAAFAQQPTAPSSASEELSDFAKSILTPDLYDDERDGELQARPEIFLQTRFSRGRVKGAEPEDAVQNFELTRIEAGWAGRLSDRVGAGLELQFHPALEGAAEELVNDAFVELYLTAGLTLRAGQFIKPFGFDVPRSSAEREFPERGMFAGYFFPGQRDRGLMLMWGAGADADVLKNTHVYAAVLNGNRFFADRDGRLDALFRVRRVFPSIGFAAGASVQIGNQLLPPTDQSGDDGVTIVGADAQYVVGNLGLRFEVVHGTMPSTLLALEPEFAPAFAPGLKTSGVTTGAIYRFTDADQAYGRFDLLDGDPVTGETAHAVDIGYLRVIDEHARIGVNWQWKNRPTFNDDEVNTRFQITIGVVF
jgi:Phosphate-selective porin O and P